MCGPPNWSPSLTWVPDRDPAEIGREIIAQKHLNPPNQLLGVPSMSLISIKTKGLSGPKYWRSLDQLADTPAFREWVHREFPANASEMLDGESRRTVLKLMAASFGLAGLTACSRPVLHALPYSKGVEDFVPGQAYFYSTATSVGGRVTGLLVEAHDGRPTKIEGNPRSSAKLWARPVRCIKPPSSIFT